MKRPPALFGLTLPNHLYFVSAFYPLSRERVSPSGYLNRIVMHCGYSARGVVGVGAQRRCVE